VVVINPSTLIGRTFGDLLDEIEPGWADRVNWGFGETGPDGASAVIGGTGPLSPEEAMAIERGNEIKASLAPVIRALRTRKLVVIGSLGEVPQQVWYVGRWRFQRDEERATEWLEEPGKPGDRREHYDPVFAQPSTSSGRKDDAIEAVIERHREELDRLPSQGAKEQFVADRVDTEPRYVRKVVKDRGLKL
jgi:hypothetical protein